MKPCPRCGAAHEPRDCPEARVEPETATAAGAAARSAAPYGVSGTLAGRYEIERPIGRGGMGEVYRARDLKLDVPVALKLLPEHLADDPGRLALLLNEVRVARQVSHPTVCRVYDVGESEGRHFLSMELIEGEPLDRRLGRKGRPPADEALSLARQISLGLAAAHERGVLHRDLKPANVMVDERAVARITDFGLAVAAAEVRGGRAREGTPTYMAPEALAGGTVTARSDLYSLGLVLAELFTGAPTSQGLREISPRLAKVVARCLETDPARRPASARGVADALPGAGTSQAGVQAAQRRADRIAAFRAELRDLRAAGVVRLDAAEDERMAAYHDGVLRDLVRDFDVDVGEREKQLSLGMRVVSLLGAIALAASAFYFLYRIWGLMAFPAQAGLLVGAPIVGLLIASAISARDRSGHFAAMAAAFAFACFVADLAMLGTVLDARPTPWVWLAWGAFALVLAYGHRLRLPLAAGIVCVGAFVAALLPESLGLEWENVLERPEGFVAAGIAAFIAPSLGAARRHAPFAALYRLIGAFLVLAPPLLMSMIGELSLLPLRPAAAANLYAGLGLVAAAGAIALGVARRYRETVYCGFGFFAAHLFQRCFHWWWGFMPRYLFFLILAAAAIAILWGLRRLRSYLSTWEEGERP